MKIAENILLKLKNTNVPTFGFLLMALFFSGISSAQSLNSSVDRDSIKIGEAVNFTIQVTSDSSTVVVFPESQGFGQLEVIDSKKPDTSFKDNQRQIDKIYSLTQFDAGTYTLPPLGVTVGDRTLKTDSLSIQVDSVAVDTTQQDLYPIKKSIDYEAGTGFPFWILWVLLALILIGAVVFLVLRRKKKKKDEKLPPYEAAIKELDELDKSDSLQRGDYKDYYSRLTASVKRYLDEKVDEGVLEKTTDEVIARIRILKNQNKLYLKEHVIQSLEAVLRRADLTKFAGHSSDKITASEDRQTIRNDIDAFDQSIAPPSEEELKRDLEYQRELKRKRRKRNLQFAIAGSVTFIIVLVATLIAFNGWNGTKDLVFGNQAEELLKKDWITSTYGEPGITLTTPEVLVRDTTSIPIDSSAHSSQLEQKATTLQRFTMGNKGDEFQIKLTLLQQLKLKNLTSEILEQHVKTTINSLNGENITMVKDSLQTYGGVKGLKISGKFTKKGDGDGPRKNYTLIDFGQNGGIQELLLLYRESEPAQTIAERVINAAKFKTEN